MLANARTILRRRARGTASAAAVTRAAEDLNGALHGGVDEHVDVVVVGAGLSGLGAAHELGKSTPRLFLEL